MSHIKRGRSVALELSTTCLALLFGVLLTCAQPQALQGQSAGGKIILAIPTHFPEVDAPAVLVRESGRDVVLLRPEEATAETLVAAIALLEDARARRPHPARGELIPMAGFVLEGALSGRERTRLEATLVALHRRPITQLGSFGQGRWMELVR